MVVLNAVVWLAKAEVPEGGIESQVTQADLAANLDPKPPRRKNGRRHSAPAAFMTLSNVTSAPPCRLRASAASM
jgi:hypothetical protein